MKLYDTGVYLQNGQEIIPENQANLPVAKEESARNTIAYSILKAHNKSDNMEKLQIKFDKLTSHDITFVGIIQTARASLMVPPTAQRELWQLVSTYGTGNFSSPEALAVWMIPTNVISWEVSLSSERTGNHSREPG